MKAPPIIITKVLVPKRRDDLLHRDRLVSFIHQHIEQKLILISASAGYGKTSLLIDYAHDTNLPVCWYSAGPSDGDLKTFLEYLLASIRQEFPEFGEQTEAMLRGPEGLPKDLDALIAALVNEIYQDIPEHFVIVIDDYHHLNDNPAVNAFFDALLNYLPENCHFILATRTLPKLTLSRLVARQAVQGLGPDDLRFTGDELQALLRRNYNLVVPEEEANELAKRSEGWIAGIVLTTHTLWQGLFERMIRAQEQGGRSGEVFEYLAGEVFQQQSPEVQEFLLGSSVLNQMSPDLCDGLLGTDSSRELLETIENKNLFLVRLPGRDDWFRYHQLFRDFLQMKVKRTDPEWFITLHCKAAALFAEREEPTEVIEHYLQAGRFEDAAEVMADVSQDTFKAGRWETLAHWIDDLPQEVLEKQPRLLLIRAKVYLQVGQLGHAIDLFDEAEHLFAGAGDVKGGAEAKVFRSVALRLQGKYDEAITDCKGALSTMDDTDRHVMGQAHRNIGICYGLQGQLVRGTEELDRALDIYRESGDDYYIAQLHHDLGTAYELIGNLDVASGHFHRARNLWQKIGNDSALGHTLNSIGVGLYYTGRYQEAEKTLQEALSKVEKTGYRRAKAYVLTSLGDLYRARREYGRALTTFEQARGLTEGVREHSLELYLLRAMADVHRLTGQYERAEGLIDQALSLIKTNGSRYQLGLCKVSQGALSYVRGNSSAALEHLAEAQAVFQQGQAKRDLARTHLHLAQVHFLEQADEDAIHHLEVALNAAESLGYDAFLAVEAANMRGLLQHAVSEGLGNGQIEAWLERIGTEYDTEWEEGLSVEESVKPSREETHPTLEVYALGKARVLKDSERVTSTDWDSAITKELFFYLLSHPDGLRKEQIMDTFWDEAEPAKASSSFHSTTYRLRGALFRECVIYDGGWYLFNPDNDYWYDVEEFERLLSEAQEVASEEEKAKLYSNAIDLYRGDYLEESYRDWCALKRQELRERYLETLIDLAEIRQNWGEFHEAVDLYRRVLDVDSYREDVHRAIMRCYTAAGDRAAALKQYEQCVQILKQELDLEPMPETAALYREIVGESQELNPS